MPSDNGDQKSKLLALIRNAIDEDMSLREQFQIGEKFRFIRDRLQALLSRAEEHLKVEEAETKAKASELAEDESLVYVHLYNAQGLDVKSWQKMLKPSVFYEYSVNRPIYPDKSHIEAFIRSRPNKTQHGYLTFAVKKEFILLSEKSEEAKDVIGHPLIKVKEGTLDKKRFISFKHNEQEYVLDDEGVMVKKEEAQDH